MTVGARAIWHPTDLKTRKKIALQRHYYFTHFAALLARKNYRKWLCITL